MTNKEPVTTGGRGSVVKLPSGLAAVPAELVAASWKWYVVFGCNPVNVALIGTGADPDPRLWVALVAPYAVDGPYWKEPVVESALGLTVPVSTPPVLVIFWAVMPPRMG